MAASDEDRISDDEVKAHISYVFLALVGSRIL